MKTFMAALFLISSSAFALELDATEAVLSILPQNEYQGKTLQGEACNIRVQELAGKVKVTASTPYLVKTSEVKAGAIYRWNPGNRSFLATTVNHSGNTVTENILRTIAVTNTTQYVVVADLTMSGRSSNESLIECIIDL